MSSSRHTIFLHIIFFLYLFTGLQASADPQKISHVIIIVQENRSFDEVLGGYGITNASGSSQNGSDIILLGPGTPIARGDYIIGPGLPVGTIVTNVDGNGVVHVSNVAANGAGDGLFTIQKVNGYTQAVWSVCGGIGLDGAGIPTFPGGPCSSAVKPYPDHIDVAAGGSHGEVAAQTDLDDGITTFLNDGYLANLSLTTSCTFWQVKSDLETCAVKSGGGNGEPIYDAMGYRSAEDIPNFWSYAQNYTVLDNFFEGMRGWSLPSHIEMVAEWAAYGTGPGGMTDPTCKGTGKPGNPSVTGCQTANMFPKTPPNGTLLPYVNLFELYDVNNVSWRFYRGSGTSPDCLDGSQQDCPPQLQSANTAVAGIWNVSNWFNWIKVGGSSSTGTKYVKDHVQSLTNFLSDVSNCNLRNVSWVVPTAVYSEHPGARTTTSMEYVTALVNSVMTSSCTDSSNGKSYWENSVIIVMYDDWGGFYDHALPPNVNYCQDAQNGSPYCDAVIEGWGLRVPAIMISPYVTPGSVDHQLLSIDSIATFVEDNFIPSQERLDPHNANLLAPSPNAPLTPDSRPTIGDSLKGKPVSFCCGYPDQIVGDLSLSGDLQQHLSDGIQTAGVDILSTHIPTGLSIVCGQSRFSLSCLPKGAPITLNWFSIAQLTSCKSRGVSIRCVPSPDAQVIYKVYRTTLDGNDANVVCTVTDPVTSCSDTPPLGQKYLYRVSATVGNLPETPPGGAMEADE